MRGQDEALPKKACATVYRRSLTARLTTSVVVLLLASLSGCNKKPEPTHVEALPAAAGLAGQPSPGDLDGDGVANGVDTSPLVSNFPLIVYGFTEPRIGVRYNVSGSSGTTETRSSSDTSTSTSTITRSSKFTGSYESRMEDQEKVAINVSLGGGAGGGNGVSFLPSFDASKTTTTTQTVSRESIFGVDDLQSRVLEAKRFNEITAQKEVKFDANSGYVRGALTFWNQSEAPVTISKMRLSVSFQSGGTRLPFLNSVPLKTSNLSVTTGPIAPTSTNVGSDAEPVSLTLPASSNASGSATRRALVISDLPYTDVHDLASEEDVAFDLEGYTVTINRAEYNRSEYERARDLSTSSLVTVTIEGPSGIRSRLVAPRSLEGGFHTVADVLRLVTGETPRLVAIGGLTVAERVGQVRSDLSWNSSPSLLAAVPSAGRWTLFVNGSPESVDLRRGLREGDEVRLTYLLNRDLQGRIFERAAGAGTLGTSVQGFETDKLTGSLERVSGSAGDRLCGPIVQVGDIVDLSVRTAASPAQTNSRSAVGRYPELGALLGGKRCSSPNESLPDDTMLQLPRDQLTSEAQVSLTFGPGGPAVSLDDLINQIPQNRTAMYSDGTLRLRFAIKGHMLSRPARVCFAAPKLMGTGAIGRRADLQDCSGESGINRLTCGAGVERCRAWLNEAPFKAAEPFQRRVRSDVELVTYSRPVVPK